MKCPKCGEELVEIVYGLPTVELMEDAKNKKVCLKGCCVVGGIEVPKYHCFKCEKDFYVDLSAVDKNNKFKSNL